MIGNLVNLIVGALFRKIEVAWTRTNLLATTDRCRISRPDSTLRAGGMAHGGCTGARCRTLRGSSDWEPVAIKAGAMRLDFVLMLDSEREAFQRAIETGDLQSLLDQLAPDVFLLVDGGRVEEGCVRATCRLVTSPGARGHPRVRGGEGAASAGDPSEPPVPSR